jgi:hypothetical protein
MPQTQLVADRNLKHFLHCPAGRALPSIPSRRPRRTSGTGVPPRAPPQPTGATCSQAARRVAQLSLVLDRRRRMR